MYDIRNPWQLATEGTGPLQRFQRNAGRWTIHANRDWRFLLGGAVFFAPTEQPRTKNRDAAVFAAGPLATAALCLGFTCMPAVVSTTPLLGRFATLNREIGLLTLIGNLMPLKSGSSGLASDGYQLLNLMRKRQRLGGP